MSDLKLHVFERAGLGKAPYKFLGVETKVGPLPLPDGTMVGSPGQPMGSCMYCSTGIKYLFWLLSADGKKFYVGSDCIYKSGDKGLKKIVDPILREKAREDRARRAKMTIEEALGLLPTVRPLLVAKPHPFGFAGKTLADYVDFCLDKAGTTGRTKVAKIIKREHAAMTAGV